jgi:hypothetical protein
VHRLAVPLVLLALASPAGAATPTVRLGLANRPGVARLAVTSAAGSLVSGAISVASTGSGASVTLAPADAHTAPRTGERFVTRGTLSGVGSWLHLADTHVSVGAHGKVDVGFSVAVPAKTKPGQYVGGIVALESHLAVTIVITVPGPSVARFAIGAASVVSPHVVAIHVANEGNVVRRPAGSVTIANAHGKTVAIEAFHMADFLPRSSVDYELALHKALRVGTYTATVRLTYPGTNGTPQTATAAPRLVVSPKPVVTTPRPKPKPKRPPTPTPAAHKIGVPWWLVGLLGAGVLLFVGTAARARVRRKPTRPHEGPHYWQVDWDRRDVDAGGALRHLHRCRDCGAEVMARDARDASLSSR